jgi:serine phosphatase RsbU (regulator of sigma subunit)
VSPLGLIVAIVIADVLTKSAQLGPLLIVAPAVTASFAGSLLTGLMGILAVAGQFLVPVFEHTPVTEGLQVQALSIAVVSGFLVAFRYVRGRQEQQLARTRSVAIATQEVLMRPLPQRSGPLRIATDYIAAEEEAQVGGDLYAAVRYDGSTRLVIGDVRGKGLPAIEATSLLLGAFHGSAYRNLPLRRMVMHLGHAMHWNWARRTNDDPEAEESFVTAVVLDIPDDARLVEMVSCGHPPPLLLREGEVSPLEARSPGFPLGLTTPSEDQYVVDTFGFEPGDILLLYTDGVIESRSPNGTFYPLAERIAAWDGNGGPEHLVQYVHQDLLAHAKGHIGDDAAIIASEHSPEDLQRGGGSGPTTLHQLSRAAVGELRAGEVLTGHGISQGHGLVDLVNVQLDRSGDHRGVEGPASATGGVGDQGVPRNSLARAPLRTRCGTGTFGARIRHAGLRPHHPRGMCGCMDLGKMLAYLVGYSLLGMAGLAVGMVCLVGLLLGAVVVIGHWVRRCMGAPHEDGHADADEEYIALASFRWETAQDPGEAPHRIRHDDQ